MSLRSTFCLVVLALVGATSAYGHVTVYTAGKFRGTSQTFYNDIPDMRQSAVGNDQASSVRITPGCLVRLFDGANYQGAFTELDRDEPDLRTAAVGNDRLSSLKIVCGGSNSWNGERAPDRIRAGVALYRAANFGGTRQVFHGDDPDLRRTQIGNDQASSVQVAPGCRARLYAAGNFGGKYAELSGAEADLRRTRVGNDKTSSLEIRCVGDNRPWNTSGGSSGGGNSGSGGSHDWGDWDDWNSDQGRGVVLFEDRDFRGRSAVFYRDQPDLNGSAVGAHRASSIRVPSGCTAFLYSERGFEGVAVRVTRSEHYLGDTRAGNDRAASLRVDCRGGSSSGGSSSSGSDDDPWGWQEDGRWGVTLYADRGFRGAADTLDRDSTDMRGTQVGNDRVSSVRVPRGCRVALYTGANYRGDYVVLHEDTDDLSYTRVGNDTVSSVRVDCH